MSFILPLSANYRLTSDAENVILQHKIERKSGTDWQNIAYHQTIGGACEYYVRLVQRKSDVKGWLELQKLTKALSTDIRAITAALDVRFADTAKVLRSKMAEPQSELMKQLGAAKEVFNRMEKESSMNNPVKGLDLKLYPIQGPACDQEVE